MALPKDYPNGSSGVHPGVVTGRGGKTDDHQDPTQAGNFQVALMGLHNFGGTITNDDLALSTKGASPDGGSQCTFGGQVDYGTVVMAYHQTGRSDVIGVNINNDVNQSGESSPGNMNLMGMFAQMFQKQDGRQRPPRFEEKKERGALIRKIVEQGPWFHDLTKGIATHAAFAQIAGNFLPQIQNVPTAVQRHTQIPTDDMMKQMPGAVQSLGQMMSSIMGNASSSKVITKNMPKETIDALQSLTALSQSGTYASLGGSVTGSRVHSKSWRSNAIELFSQAKTTADLLETMGQLMHDTSLHGLDQIGDTTFEIETPFGNTSISIDATGNTSETIANTTNQAMKSFAQNYGLCEYQPYGIPGLNMFGKSSGTMFEMAQRLPMEMQTAFKKMMEGLNQSGTEPDQYQRRTTFYQGGTPLE